MTARWEPLETAAEVVAACEAGLHIEYEGGPRGWAKARMLNPYVISSLIAHGAKYRALIEDSK